MSKDIKDYTEFDENEKRSESENDTTVDSLKNKITNLEKQNEILIQNLEKVKISQETVANLENEIVQLNNKIADLEEDNTILVERSEKQKFEQLGKEMLLEKITELEESIISLEKVNKIHRDNIDQIREEKFTEVNKLENEIERLNALILNLEEENKTLIEGSESPVNGQLYKIADLEYKINEQTAYISFLEEDNTELRKKVKPDQDENVGEDLKQNIHRLQKKIVKLEKENNELNEKNEVLKTALLLHIDTETKEINNIGLPPKTEQIQEEPEISQTEDISIKSDLIEIKEPTQVSTILGMEELKEHEVEVPKGLVQELVNKRNTAMEESVKDEPVSVEDVPEVSTGRVQELVNRRHAAMEEGEKEELMRAEDEPKVSTGKVQEMVRGRGALAEEQEISNEPTLPPKPIISERVIEEVQEVPPPAPKAISKTKSAEMSEVSNLDSIGVIETPDGRRKCPICNNQNQRLIREVDDKSKVINAYPKMYGKKFKCGQCGAEWRYK